MGTRLKIGDTVMVDSRKVTHHHRTPAYVYGKIGLIEKIHGEFKNPEQLSYGKDGIPEKILYSVLFKYAEIDTGNNITQTDELMMDIFEHWLTLVPSNK